MLLKIAIVIVFLMLLVSLFSGFAFLMKDMGGTRRTWHALSVRLGLAVLLMGLLIYGVTSGQLGSKAPWDARKTATAVIPAPQAPVTVDKTTKAEENPVPAIQQQDKSSPEKQNDK